MEYTTETLAASGVVGPFKRMTFSAHGTTWTQDYPQAGE